MREEAGEFGVAQQRLGGDTADIEADSAPVFRLDDGGAQTQLGSPHCGGVTTGARAQHDEIEVCTHGHCFPCPGVFRNLAMPGPGAAHRLFRIARSATAGHHGRGATPPRRRLARCPQVSAREHGFWCAEAR